MRLPLSAPFLSTFADDDSAFAFLADTCRLACRVLAVCCKPETPRWATISPLPAQTINGIGVSGAWWPLDLHTFPIEQKEKVAELLFSKETGLGLSSYRYNIGGGGKGVGNPSRTPPTPYLGPGEYNFTADEASNFYLLRAASYGVEQLTIFVNSAPSELTSNGEACGGMMTRENVPAFATYLADVIGWWEAQEGLGVRWSYVSPMNEPDNNFANIDGSPCRQEGMAVSPVLRATIPAVLRLALDSHDPPLTHVGILADETSTVPEFLPEIPLWLPKAKDSIAAVAHHDYLFADDRSAAMMGVEGRALSGGREMWFTEICCFKTADGEREGDPLAPFAYGQSYDPTMVGALQLGVMLYKSFVVVGDAHFDWWTALSSSLGCSPTNHTKCATTPNKAGYNDALIYYDHAHRKNGNYELYVTKRFWLLRHFALYVPIGSVRHNVLGGAVAQRVLAFQMPSPSSPPPSSSAHDLLYHTRPRRTADWRWTVIVMNMSPLESMFELEYVEMGGAREAWRTSEAHDWERVRLKKDGPGRGGEKGEGRFQMTLPGLSITTVLFD